MLIRLRSLFRALRSRRDFEHGMHGGWRTRSALYRRYLDAVLARIKPVEAQFVLVVRRNEFSVHLLHTLRGRRYARA